MIDIPRLAAQFDGAVTTALRHGDVRAIPEDALRQVLTAAVKAYAAKAEALEASSRPMR